MVAALVAGERDPRAIADLARGAATASGPPSPRRWTAWFDSHHGVIAQALLRPVDVPGQRSSRTEEPAPSRRWPRCRSPGAWTRTAKPGPGRGAGPDPRCCRRLPAGRDPRRGREAGRRADRRDRPEHERCSRPRRRWSPGWGCAGRPPGRYRAPQGPRKKGHGNTYARAVAGLAAIRPAANTDTFLGERFRRLVARRRRRRAA